MRGAKVQNEIVRTVAERQRKKARLWHEFLTQDGHLPGQVPMTKEEEAIWLSKMAPYLPELAQTNPTRAAQLMQRIDALLRTEGGSAALGGSQPS